MQNPSKILLPLFFFTGLALGQEPPRFQSLQGPFYDRPQLPQSIRLSGLSMCTDEICFRGESGHLGIKAVSGWSISAIIDQISQPDEENYPVFYSEGQERNPRCLRILRKRYLVTLSGTADLKAVQKRCGMKSIKRVRVGSTIAMCEEESAGRVLSQLSKVLADLDVLSVEPLLARKRFLRAIPSDPFYDLEGDGARPDGVYQWYLNNIGINGGAPEIDINLEPALDLATGRRVTVAIVDDGLSTDHLDLAANAMGPHLNLLDGIPDDPTTFDEAATHGTKVAGLIAASFNNGEGISGVAPNANLSGIRLLGELIDDADEAAALSFMTDVIDVYNNSWGPDDTIFDQDGPGPLTRSAIQSGIEDGRVVGGDAKGVIYVWAAGDGGTIGDNSNDDGYANSKHTIAVGAVDDTGRRAGYSERGANLVVVAPSDGGSQGLITTSYQLGVDDNDLPIRTTAYDTNFGGTSA